MKKISCFLIPNVAGKNAALRVFNKIAGERGLIDSDSAKEGLQWFGEYVSKAEAHPGRHKKLELLMNLKPGQNFRVEKSLRIIKTCSKTSATVKPVRKRPRHSLKCWIRAGSCRRKGQ